MAGAYVAKPADPPTRTCPPGWNPNTPLPGDTSISLGRPISPDPFFPAPYPPGYTPDFSLSVTGSNSIAYTGAASITGSARDRISYPTNEPSAISWTATIDGVSIGLKFSGEAWHTSSLTSPVSFGTYWDAALSIEFDLTADNVGDIIVLTGSYILDGIRVTQTKAIAIVELTATFTLTFDFGHGEIPWLVFGQSSVTVKNPSIFNLHRGFSQGWDGVWSYEVTHEQEGDVVTGMTVDAEGHEVGITYSNLADNQYVEIYLRTNDTWSGHITAHGKLVVGEDEYTTTLTGDHLLFTWLRLYNDGTVEIVNP